MLGREPQWRADASLAELRAATPGGIDPCDPSHARALLRWLNRWGCRLPYPDDGSDPFGDALGAWWVRWSAALPSPDVRVDALPDAAIAAVAEAADDLACLVVSSPAGRRRRLGWTAASKLLFVLRPDSLAPWDAAIARRVGGASRPAFDAHLRAVRESACVLVAEAVARGIDDVPAHVGRPDSTLAKVIDEWLYLTVTRGAPVG